MAKTCGKEMMERVASARKHLTPDAVGDIARFVAGRMNPDGGFRGRGSESDIYYTVFGAGCLSALDSRIPLLKTMPYVKGFGDGAGLDFVHLTCLVRCLAGMPGGGRSAKEALRRLDKYRSADGGFSLTHESAAGSVYACFLALLAYQDAGRELPDPEGIVRCVSSLRLSDGGYAGEPGSSSGTTTVTAAAAIVLKQLGQSDPGVEDWLLARCSGAGGVLAGPSAPIPDLLSTATAIHALSVVGARVDRIRDSNIDFIESMWDEGGGFCGSSADRTPDVEYTFYALLALGNLV